MVRRLFAPCTSRVSRVPGVLTWHPMRKNDAATETIARESMACLLAAFMIVPSLDNNRHIHIAVVGAAEVIADRRERSRLLRCHGYFYGLTGRYLLVQLQGTKEKSVSHVFAVNA